MVMNKLYDSVRITHMPTGITVECGKHRTAEENRETALRVLRAKVYAALNPEPSKLRAEHGNGDYFRWVGLDLANAMDDVKENG